MAKKNAISLSPVEVKKQVDALLPNVDKDLRLQIDRELRNLKTTLEKALKQIDSFQLLLFQAQKHTLLNTPRRKSAHTAKSVKPTK
jgi:hypothetical protein